jgi:hypothetical protein
LKFLYFQLFYKILGYIISCLKKINVGNYEIKPFSVLRYTNLNIFVVENNKVLYKNDIINNASKYGHIKVLEWFKNSGYELKYNNDAIISACGSGHIQVLEWFKNFGYKFKYNWTSLDDLDLDDRDLEWFINSGYKFNYNSWQLIVHLKMDMFKF